MKRLSQQYCARKPLKSKIQIAKNVYMCWYYIVTLVKRNILQYAAVDVFKMYPKFSYLIRQWH